MALSVGDRSVRPLTVDEVMRMVDAGILGEDERLELLHGVLTVMSPKSPEHEAVKARLLEWLFDKGTSANYAVRVEGPVVVSDPTSLPEPDVAVIERGGPPNRHPVGALLVAEVAVSSLRVDTQVKPPLFAAAGVPEMWVVDVAAQTVIVFRHPGPDGYASRRTAQSGLLAPAAVDVEPLDLARLFEGL